MTEVLIVGTALKGVPEGFVLADVAALEFDERTDLWRVEAADGLTFRPRVVIAGPDTLGKVRRSWREDLKPFRGIAMHGLPNFFLTPPDRSTMRYLRRCLAELAQSGATRIEVRASVQHEHGRRAQRPRGRRWRRLNPDHFEWTTADDRESPEEYTGTALLGSEHAALPVKVALSGHLEPIDGRYHWYGRVAADDAVTALKGRRGLTLALPGRDPVPARLTELDPLGNARICGEGSPPFPLETLETLET